MQPADTQRVEAFLNKWLGSEDNEYANYQIFFGDMKTEHLDGFTY